MTLNGHFALNSVLRRYVWSSEAWLSKLGYCRQTLTEKNSCSIAWFPCDSTAFLLHHSQAFIFSQLMSKVLKLGLLDFNCL